MEDVRSKSAREDLYIKEVEQIIRGNILDSYGNKAQWSLPVEKQTNGEGTKKVGTINMENYKVRKLIEMIDSIIDISVVDDERKIALKKSISHYKKLMTIMKKRGKLYGRRNS